uniref:Bromo domain-containing protein n=1 Tax=Kwoniella dejecticola CBS 10117 TaxID=1296121 RepID=A0A1A5ZVH2_9TREE|nr:uncharacterized protein I303_07713 [Kwoniella dejecticola CBS 10117]OBR81803.1 hypothetical protein I303_07713 [Kwoniella dejecticola CBS 10117]
MSSEVVGASTRSLRRDASASSSTTKPESPSKGNASEEGTATTEKIRKKRLDVNPALILVNDGGRSKRRRTQSQEPDHHLHHAAEDKDPKDSMRAKELGYVIFKRIMDAKSSDGEDLAHPFIKLPNKRAFPDYYETIKHPLSLEIVQQRLDASEYQTLKDVCADLGQIFNNAKRYNVKESLIFQYAKKLHKMTRVYYANVLNPDRGEDEDADADADGEVDPEGDIEMEDNTTATNAPGAPPKSATKRTRRRGAYMKDGPSLYKLIKPALKAIKEAKARDGSGREIAGIFAQLPSRRDLPDYYNTIRYPISLEEIESKHIGRRYESFQEFAEDIELMCQNGMQYNEDGSEVYRDAQQIREVLQWHQAGLNRSQHNAMNRYPPQQSSTPNYPRPQPAYSHSPAGGPVPLPFPIPASVPTQGLTPYSPGPSRSPQPPVQGIQGIQGHRAYLPALPPGVVTDEIVATLDRYPPYERQAWIQSLSPLAVNMYRTMLATNEARKRGLAQPPVPQQQISYPTPPHSQSQSQPQQSPLPSQQILQQASRASPAYPQAQQTPSNHQTSSQIQHPAQGQKPVPRTERAKPPVPTIKYIDFTFSSASVPTEPDKTSSASRQTIRLKNLRGLITHAIILNANTSEIELIAYIDDTPVSSSSSNGNDGDKAITNGNGNGVPVPVPVLTPELSLRINGNQGSLPRFVYAGGRQESTGKEGEGEKPKGMKWTLHVSTSKVESRIEIVATKPGALAETTTIFVSRQF